MAWKTRGKKSYAGPVLGAGAQLQHGINHSRPATAVYCVGSPLFFSIGQGDIQHRLQFGWRERRGNQDRAIIGSKNNINAGNTGSHMANVFIAFGIGEMQLKNAELRAQTFQPALTFIAINVGVRRRQHLDRFNFIAVPATE
ncbi:hypothetical protein D3C78_1373930 [compost metagenome]